MSKALNKAFAAAHAGEVLANYGLADQPFSQGDGKKGPEELRFLERRVDDAVNGRTGIEALIRKLSLASDVKQLKYLSGKAGIEWRRWSKGGSISSEAVRLVDKAGKQTDCKRSCAPQNRNSTHEQMASKTACRPE